MTKDEALKLALGIARSMFAADDAYGCGYYNDPSWRAAYRELRKITQEALAHAPTEQEQPAQQEPVAWMDIDEKGAASGLRYWHEPENRHEVPLYTTPPQRTWVGLTADELNMIGDSMRTWNSHSLTDVYVAIEAKLKEKNT